MTDNAIAEHNARVEFENSRTAIHRSLMGAIEQAAEQFIALGLSNDETGQWIESAFECSDWADYLNED